MNKKEIREYMKVLKSGGKIINYEITKYNEIFVRMELNGNRADWFNCGRVNNIDEDQLIGLGLM